MALRVTEQEALARGWIKPEPPPKITVDETVPYSQFMATMPNKLPPPLPPPAAATYGTLAYQRDNSSVVIVSAVWFVIGLMVGLFFGVALAP